jgi:hypothetical protein
MRLLKRSDDFRAGKWINLTFDKDLSGWQVTQGKWEARGETRVAGHGTPSDPGYGLRQTVSLPAPFELECEMSWEKKPGPSTVVGVIIGHYRGGGSTNQQCGPFWVEPQADRCGVFSATAGKIVKPADLSGPVKLRIKAWEQHYAMYVNGELKVNTPDSQFDPGDDIELGPIAWGGESGLVIYSNVRIRKLDEKPDTENVVK